MRTSFGRFEKPVFAAFIHVTLQDSKNRFGLVFFPFWLSHLNSLESIREKEKSFFLVLKVLRVCVCTGMRLR